VDEMSVDNTKIKLDELYALFIAEFDEEGAETVWTAQSEEFRQFWDEELPGGEKLKEGDFDYVIRFLDSHAKGIADSDVEPACNPFITQGSWYRIFEEFQSNKKLYDLVTLILRCESDDDRAELLNQLYSVNVERNRLTGKNAVMINDLMFVYNPVRNISVVSLSHRCRVIDAFSLGDSSKIRAKSWGEQIILSKNTLLGLRNRYAFRNLRSLSLFLYSFEVKRLWSGREIIPDIDLELDERFEEEGFFEIPIGDRKILTEPGDRPIKTLCEKVDKGKLVAKSDFQRHYIWDTKPKLKSKLIESVLLRVPIPVIYTAEEIDGKELVVDGQQRLLTFYNFIKKDGFKLSGLRVLKELNGKRYEDLDEKLQDAIDEYPIRVVRILKESHKDIKFDIFERLNRGSVKLNEQELRNCVYRGSFNDLLKSLAMNRDFQRLQGLRSVHKRMIDVERILRFFAFTDLTERKYKGPLTSFLNAYMESRREISDRQKEEKISLFKKSVELCQSIFGELAFRRWRLGNEEDPNGRREEKINEGIFDVQMYGFTEYNKRDVIGKAMVIKEAFIDLMTLDGAFVESIEKGTYDTTKVKFRTEKWFQRLREVIGYPAHDRRFYTFEEKEALFKSSRVCHLCGNEISFIEDAHVDHIERYSEGGKTTIKNGKLSHRYCNQHKG